LHVGWVGFLTALLFVGYIRQFLSLKLFGFLRGDGVTNLLVSRKMLSKFSSVIFGMQMEFVRKASRNHIQ